MRAHRGIAEQPSVEGRHNCYARRRLAFFPGGDRVGEWQELDPGNRSGEARVVERGGLIDNVSNDRRVCFEMQG